LALGMSTITQPLNRAEAQLNRYKPSQSLIKLANGPSSSELRTRQAITLSFFSTVNGFDDILALPEWFLTTETNF
jgi:hypothetical protein